MAAAQASPHNSGHTSALNQGCCEKPVSDSFLDRHVCARCGKARPLGRVGADETFFSALGVPEKFKQDPSELQKNFYQISRALHPDRFGTADAEARQRSLERMSFVNEAYATLRDPRALREYVLSLHGLKTESSGARGQVPMELAELWFELQDDLSAENVAKFRSELKSAEEGIDASVRKLEEQLDALNPRSTDYLKALEELAQSSQRRNYLNSMNRDLETKLRGSRSNE